MPFSSTTSTRSIGFDWFPFTLYGPSAEVLHRDSVSFFNSRPGETRTLTSEDTRS